MISMGPNLYQSIFGLVVIVSMEFLVFSERIQLNNGHNDWR
jgi:hypothetical protein